MVLGCHTRRHHALIAIVINATASLITKLHDGAFTKSVFFITKTHLACEITATYCLGEKMKKITIVLGLILMTFLQSYVFAKNEQNATQLLPETLVEDTALLVQCFSYSTPGSINLPMGTLTVAGLLPGDPHLTVTFAQLLGNPITGTLHGDGKRTTNGVTGTIKGALNQFGAPKIWVTSELTAVFPDGTTKGTLTMTNLGSNLELTNGCSE